MSRDGRVGSANSRSRIPPLSLADWLSPPALPGGAWWNENLGEES